jgi:toxin CcdB
LKDREGRPYVVVVQSDVLASLNTRVVVPLALATEISSIPRLHPRFEIEGRAVCFFPTDIAVFPSEPLRSPVTNLSASRDAIIAALDIVFTGI